MSSDRYYKDVGSVKELFTTSDVNSHLADGTWELLKIGEIATGDIHPTGMVVQNTRLIYVVGMKRSGSSIKQETTPSKSRAFEKACDTCGARIKLEQVGGRWLPRNLDGSDHQCRK